MDVFFGKTNLIETVFPGGNFAKVPAGHTIEIDFTKASADMYKFSMMKYRIGCK